MQVSVPRALARAGMSSILVATLALLLAACSQSVASPSSGAVYSPTSIADAGNGDWETSPTARELAYRSGTIRAASAPAVVAVRTPTYTTTTPASYAFDETPPPPPPPSNLSVGNVQPPAGATAPAPTFVGPSASGVDPCAPCPPAAPVRTITDPCQLPCAQGVSMWHVRGLGGYVFYSGDDPGEDCGYWGVDFGRTFCGCWGLDLFYRWNSGQFDRILATDPNFEDGGDWHHFGIKLTYESQFSQNSRFYWWAGLGPEYYTTDGYIEDDSGFGIFAEVGIGYYLNQNFRIRAGVAFHGVDTEVTREDPADDGDSRWLWLIAPHLGVEFDF